MKLSIHKGTFKESAYELLSYGDMRVIAFKYSTGVEALKIENKKGHIVILPFQGQQIWNIHFGGRDLTMNTTIKEPVPTTEYLKTYGGFLYHCGATAMGVPQADDNHEKHGELPNIEYKSAQIVCDEDETGKFISVEGELDYDIAFVVKYSFRPKCRIYENSSVLKVSVDLENMKNSPMEYMYLCHINFCQIPGAKLHYNVPRNKEHIKMIDNIPDNVTGKVREDLRKYMDEIYEDYTIVDRVGKDFEAYDPEVTFVMTYKPGEDNRGYTLQYEEGKGACYVNHPLDTLSVGVRWISKTPDESSMGMVLPATAEHLGYNNAKRLGQIKVLAPRETVSFYIETGYLEEADAKAMIQRIDGILEK